MKSGSNATLPLAPTHPPTTAAIGRIVNLQKQKHYNYRVCHSAQPDGTFHPSINDPQINVRIVGVCNALKVLPTNIVPLPSRELDLDEDGWVLTHDMSVALREDGRTNDGVKETILHNLLQHLPILGGVEVLLNEVLSYVCIERVDSLSVRAVEASSQDGNISNNDISYTLEDRLDRWWISGAGSCPNGKGKEWVSYDLCPNNNSGRSVQVNLLRLVIPPLPQGPLSVRKFHLEASDTSASNEGPWTAATEELTTLDSGDVQEWSIYPPIESRFVRIICRENAAAVFNPAYACIGFFTIGFS